MRRSWGWRPTDRPVATGWWPVTAAYSPLAHRSSEETDRPVRLCPLPATCRPPDLLGSREEGPCSAGPDDGLQLRVGLEAVVATVPSNAAHLEPAEGRIHVALGGVDADMAGPEQFGHPERPGGVSREDVVVEAELRVVGDGDALLLVVEGDGHHHRAEDLLAGRGHVVGAGDEGGLHVEPGGQVIGTVAADHHLALSAAGVDVVEHPLLLGGGDQWSDHGLPPVSY